MKQVIFFLILLYACQETPRAQEAHSYQQRKSIQASELARYRTKQNRIKRDASYPGDQNIDITYYKLDLTVTVNPEPNYLRGRVTVKGKSNIDNLHTVSLDLVNSLIIDSIKTLETNLNFSQTPGTALISLDHDYTLHEAFEMDIYYSGVPLSGAFGGFFFGVGRASTLSESYSAPLWWPCKDDPKDKADSADIWITCKQIYKVGSNGMLIDTVNNGDGTHTYKWKVRYPIANYLIAFALAEYNEYRDYYRYGTNDSLLILNYLYGSGSPSIGRTKDMIGIFSDLFGEYPFIREKYGHCQFDWGGAMEHQTMTFVTGINDELTVSHELAHQWFGDMITCRDWHHIWINEGFAMYASALYYERYYGSAAYDNEIHANMADAKYAAGSVWIQDISNEWKIFNWNLTYAKGCCILHMLRHAVGDSVFFSVLRAYAAHPDYRYKTATADDFQSICESVSGIDLDYFFRQWIYGENYPRYRYGWKYSVYDGRHRLQLRIKQDVNPKPPSFFTMPIDVRITYADGGDTILRVFNNQQDQVFTFFTQRKPSQVLLDPGQWILRDIYTLPFDDDTTELKARLRANYPNPFSSETVISFELKTPSRVEINIYNIIGQKIITLLNRACDAGETYVRWDGKNDHGQAVADGVYLCRLKAGRFSQTRKMAMVRDARCFIAPGILSPVPISISSSTVPRRSLLIARPRLLRGDRE